MNNTKETLSSVRDVIPDIGGNFQLDPAVIEKFPEGTHVLQASSYGTSLWTRTARVATTLNGEKKDYFLKCATEAGASMTEGEFHSISEIYKLIPTLTPRPVAWGKFRNATIDTYFFLCDFVDMSTSLPDPAKFCARISQLHRESVSPTGKFGFHIKNCKGKTPQPIEWEENWTRYFTRLISYGFERDLVSNGPWPEYEEAFARLVKDVIPQILDPLTEEGRTIKPCLVHGDLWEGNTTTNLETGEPMIFDAAAFYAHNEYELGIWRREMVRFGKPFFKQYLRSFPPSEPVEQFDDRNALYVLKFDLDYCLHRPGLPLVREQILTDILRLVNKYPPNTNEGPLPLI
ncbi:Fructosamine kinase-domain-containing protein [Diaporthe sp. PMI_573]|nr:Fructosamine kinase-domain-containing protein [Diaporthaceae sp. PMI_573]